MARCSKSLQKFCRAVREMRGNQCERCRATEKDGQIESHHVLDIVAYSDLAKEEDNILVLCQRCHSYTQNRETRDYRLRRLYASLPDEVMERVAGFIELHAPDKAAFAADIRRVAATLSDEEKALLRSGKKEHPYTKPKSALKAAKKLHQRERNKDALRGNYDEMKRKYGNLRGYSK